MTDPNRPRPAAAYLRVSTEDQRERATIETQRVEIEKHVAAQSVPLVDLYPDDGWSGRKLTLSQRPAGRHLLAEAAQGRFDTVIVYPRGSAWAWAQTARIARRARDSRRALHHQRDRGPLRSAQPQ